MTTNKKTTETTEEPTVTVDGRKITWGYSKKVQTADYETHEVSIYMTDQVPADVEHINDHLVAETANSFDLLKVEVWGALGLDVEYTPEGHPQLVKVVAPPRPIAPVPVAPTDPLATGPVAAPVAAPVPVAGSLVGVYAPAPAFCKDCGAQGLDAFWDNRAAMDTKISEGKKIGPDFKCRTCEGGNGNEKPIYRPGSYDYNKAVGQPPAVAPAMTPPVAAAPAAPEGQQEFGSGEAPF